MTAHYGHEFNPVNTGSNIDIFESSNYSHSVELGPTTARPVPLATELSRPFWDGCRRGVLLVQRCARCATHVFIPQDFCPTCRSTDLKWVESGGKGVIVTYTVVWRAPTPAFEVPYVVAVVAVAEGYEMVTNIVATDRDQIRIGAGVRVVFREISPEVTLPCFTVVPS